MKEDTDMKNILGMIVLLFAATVPAGDVAAENVGAYKVVDDGTFVVDGVSSSNIRVARDGTGIVKGIKCNSCTSKVLTITGETKFFIDGKQVDSTKVNSSRKNMTATVQFNLSTNKVVKIRW